MAKLAAHDAKPFSPIARKLIEEVSGPPQPLSAAVYGEDAPVASTPQLQVMSPQREPSPPVYAEASEHLTRQMRYGATPAEERETKDFVRRVSTATGVSLTHSNLMRSCRDLLFQVEDKLIDEIRRANLRRPINDKHAIARFEARMTEIIRTAIRQSPLSYRRGVEEQ
jgi:hypothetical protein